METALMKAILNVLKIVNKGLKATDSVIKHVFVKKPIMI